MRTNLLAALGVFLAVSLCPDDLFAQLKKVRLSIPSIGTNSMLFGLAGEKGFFREVGLEVEQINMQGSLGVKALIGGDVGYSAASGSIITAALRGIDVKLVSILSPAPVFRMIGQKQFKSIKDLKGKVVALSSRGGTLDHLTRIMLEKNGLAPDRAEGIKALIKHGGLTDPSLAIDTYEEYRWELSPDGLADDKWMKKAMEFILKVIGTNERVSPAKVFDFSLTREAIGRVN